MPGFVILSRNIVFEEYVFPKDHTYIILKYIGYEDMQKFIHHAKKQRLLHFSHLDLFENTAFNYKQLDDLKKELDQLESLPEEANAIALTLKKCIDIAKKDNNLYIKIVGD